MQQQLLDTSASRWMSRESPESWRGRAARWWECPAITLPSGLPPGRSGSAAEFAAPALGLSHQLGAEKENGLAFFFPPLLRTGIQRGFTHHLEMLLFKCVFT